MDDHRLGFLGPSSLIIGFLTLLITAGIWMTHGGTFFSPGPLSARKGQPIQGITSHAELGGKCSACHGGPLQSGTMDDRCVACHIDIPAQQKVASTLHGNLQQNNGPLECRDCHQEHGGILKDIRKANVDHGAFGYSLEEHQTKTGGAGFACSDCHRQDYITFDAGVCIQCHLQENEAFLTSHQADFGDDCLACHGGNDPYRAGFDHNQLPFSLRGGHAGTDCTQCHQNARSPADLRSAPTDCNSCHSGDNPHSARLGTDCASCHTVNDWQSNTFDHNLSTYKLNGSHAGVACTDCHVNNVYIGTPTDCNSCHQADDTHKGQYGTDCASCHTEAGWKQATPFDHNAFAYKLTGQHTKTSCLNCHVNNVFKGTPTECEACHRDEHGGGLYSHCAYCHTPDYW